MAQNLVDVEMEDASFEKRTYLLYGDIYRTWIGNSGMKRTSVQFAEDVLLHSGYLRIVDVENSEDPEVQRQFAAAVDSMREKLKHFKSNDLRDAKSRSKVARKGSKEFHLFFDLSKYDALVDIEPSQPSSQGSTLSDMSDAGVEINSQIEREVPSRPKNALKKFSQLNTKYKREKSQEAYKFLQDFSDGNNISYLDLICHLGARGFYINDKKLAETFDAVAAGYRVPLELPMDKSVYLKTRFADTQRLWTEFKYQFKGMVNVPTYKKLNAYTEETMPELIPFKRGWRFELFEFVNLTLQRLPYEVILFISFKQFLLINISWSKPLNSLTEMYK